MKLTNKCKEDFEKWFLNNHNIDVKKFDAYEDIKLLLGDFNNLPQSMQYGVYVDFFDGVGVMVNVKINHNGYFSSVNGYTTWDKPTTIRGYVTRQEARQQAITKANEIYNLK